MRDGQRVAVIIPALNEAPSIGHVVGALPSWVDETIVADNGSIDGTGEVARQAGARVVREEERGYGAACLTAMDALTPCEIVAYLDGDFSDRPEELDRLVDPILRDEADLVIGSRTLGVCEPGALTPQQRFGNRIACSMIRLLFGQRCTDLGPFRAIRRASLAGLAMCDRNYGWTVEMQVKAAQRGLRTVEVPVSYRRRIGRSKVSGTLRGVLGASYKIPITILRHAFAGWVGSRTHGGG